MRLVLGVGKEAIITMVFVVGRVDFIIWALYSSFHKDCTEAQPSNYLPMNITINLAIKLVQGVSLLSQY